MQEQIDTLQQQVQELLDWKKQRELQQITYPLDINSRNIINKYFLAVTDEIDFINASGGVVPNILTRQNGIDRAIEIYPTLYQYGANIVTNFITVTEGQFNNDDRVFFLSTGDFPVPLDDSTLFYVVNSTNNGQVFQVSTTMGGSPIDITTSGNGKQFIYFDQL